MKPIIQGFLKRGADHTTAALLRAAVVSGSLLGPMSASHASEIGELLRAALEHPAVQARAQDMAAARDEVSAANRRYFGGGRVNAETARYEDQRFVGVLSPATFADPPFAQNVSRYGVTYSLPIDLFGVIAASREAAKSNLVAAELLERQEVLLKLHDATNAYVQLQALQRQEVALQSQRQRVDATIERVRREVQVQLAAGVDLKLAESEGARIASEEVRLRGAMDETRATLEEAAGQSVLPSVPPLPVPPWPTGTTEGALPLLLARAQADASSAQARQARRTLLPSLAAVGDYYEYSGTGGIPDEWSVGARFVIPIDPSAYRSASASDARARAASHRAAAAERDLMRQWTALKTAYDSAVADLMALEKEVVTRREVVAVQVELQRVGMTSMEDLLRQQRDLVDSESRRAAAQARAVMAWSAAQVLLGADAQKYIEEIETN